MSLPFHRFRLPGRLVLRAAAALVALSAGAVAPSSQADLAGVWRGILAVGNSQLHIAFNVSEAQDGQIEATMDSPDQGATGIPVAKVILAGQSVRFEIDLIKAIYVGQLSSEQGTIEGEWQQSGYSFPLTVERAERGSEGR